MRLEKKLLFHNYNFWFIILFLFCLGQIFLGCAPRRQYYYKPTTPSQKLFYEVRTYHEGGREEQVIQKGEEFLTKFPDNILCPAVKYYIGNAAYQLGQKSKATRYYEEILTHHPDSSWAKLARFNLEELVIEDRKQKEQKERNYDRTSAE